MLLAAPSSRAGDAIVGSLICPESLKVSPGDLVTKKGFSAQFWPTNDEHVFLNWIPGSMVNLFPIKMATRLTPVYFAIFFAGPGVRLSTDAMGDDVKISDVTYHWALVRPDGNIHSMLGPMSAWSGPAPSSREVHLISNKPSITFQANDPAGRYTVHVLVRDNVRKVEVDLERPLVLKD